MQERSLGILLPLTVVFSVTVGIASSVTSTGTPVPVSCYECRSGLDARCRDPFDGEGITALPGFVTVKANCTTCIKWSFNRYVIRACGTAEIAPRTPDAYLQQSSDAFATGHMPLLNFDYLSDRAMLGRCAYHSDLDSTETCLCGDKDLCNKGTSRHDTHAAYWRVNAVAICATAIISIAQLFAIL